MKRLNKKELKEIANKTGCIIGCVNCAQLDLDLIPTDICAFAEKRSECKTRKYLIKEIANYILKNNVFDSLSDFVDIIAKTQDKLYTFAKNYSSKKLEKPKRDKIINKDDITNLKIALESSKTFDEFLEVI
jgi:hypothetical protein